MKMAILLLILITSLQAVIRRDDVPDSEYINFAKDPRFSCVGLVKGSIGSSTGTLIDPYTVLTVAHGVKTAREEVVFNIANPLTGKIASIKGFIQIHEDYIYTYDDAKHVKEIHNDIALIHLASPVNFVTPATLDYIDIQNKTSFVSAGFGKNGVGNSDTTYYDKEQRGFTNNISEFLSEEWCDNCYISYFDAPNTIECSPLEGVGAQGDSGAGVFRIKNNTFYLIGIIHLLAGKGAYGSYNLILPITPYMEWIEKNRLYN